MVAGIRSIRDSLGDDRDLATYRPKVCYFPALIPNAGRIARLPSGAWWLPAAVAAREVRLGSKLRAYVIQEPFGPEKPDIKSAMVIWSPTGQQQATFAVNQDDQVKVLDSAGAPVNSRTGRRARRRATNCR